MSLLAWYKLDGDANDSSGNDFHGTISGDGDWVSGKVCNQSRLFSGNNSQIVIPHNDLLSKRVFGYATVFSFSVWYFPTAWVNWGCLVNKAFGGSWSNTTAGLWAYSGGIRFLIGSNVNSNPSGSVSGFSFKPSLNEWHHIVGVANGDRLLLYIDGILRGGSFISGVTRPRAENTSPITIGPRYQNHTSGIRGHVQDLRIYDHPLSQKDVRDLSRGKIGHWSFNEFQEPTNNLWDLSVSSRCWSSNSSNACSLRTNTGRHSLIVQGNCNVPGAYPYIYPLYNSAPGSPHTLSATVKNNNNKTLEIRARIRDDSNGSLLSTQEIFYIEPWNTEKISVSTHTINSASRVTPTFTPYTDSSDGSIDLELTDIQLERKSHYTRFTPGSRGGVILDSSGYGHHVELENETTPKWCPDGYEFDGTHKEIVIHGTPNITGDQSISMWLYPTSFSTRRNPWNKAYGGEGTITQETNGTLNFYWGTNGGDSHPYQGVNSGVSLNLNQWNHIVLVRDLGHSQIRWYINGVVTRKATAAYSASAPTDQPIIVGNGYTSPYHGKINDVRLFATCLSDNDVQDLYKSFGSIDDGGNLRAPRFNEVGAKPLILDYTVWEDGQTGGVGQFWRNGSASENHRIIGTDPWGKNTVLWEARPDSTSGPDGGWNSSHFSVDHRKLYRFSVWVNRTFTGNGSFYLGCYGYVGSSNGVIRVSDGVVHTNPYFWIGIPSRDTWTLVVGHIFPSDYSDSNLHPDSGRYTIDGRFGNISNDFKWRPSTTSARHRSYLYYTTNTNTRQRWAYPRVDVCDGTEPSIEELLSGFDSRNIDLIRAKGGKGISLELEKHQANTGRISEVAVTNGLIAFYPFTDDPIIRDLSGNGYHGFNDWAILLPWKDGKFVYGFSGSMNITLPQFYNPSHDNPVFLGTPPSTPNNWNGNCTYSAWFKANDFGGSVFSDNNGNEGKIDFLSDRIRCYWSGNNEVNFFKGVSIGEWYHVVMSHQKDDISGVYRLKFYVNGILVGQNNVSISGSSSSYGPDNSLVLGNGFKGMIGDVRIYNRVLTSEEVNVLYDSSTFRMSLGEGVLYISGGLKEGE